MNEARDRIIRLYSIYGRNLDPRSAKVMKMRFGIGYPRGHYLDEVGKEFGISRERVRQIETRAVEKMEQMARDARERQKTYCPYCRDNVTIFGEVCPQLKITGERYYQRCQHCGKRAFEYVSKPHVGQIIEDIDIRFKDGTHPRWGERIPCQECWERFSYVGGILENMHVLTVKP